MRTQRSDVVSLPQTVSFPALYRRIEIDWIEVSWMAWEGLNRSAKFFAHGRRKRGEGQGDASPAIEKSAGDVPPEMMIFLYLFS